MLFIDDELPADFSKVVAERRSNQERRVTTSRTHATGEFYFSKDCRLLPERRKIIRRASDRASNWRRGFWRDQQRNRFAAHVRDEEKLKRDNLLFSNKRIAIARKKALEQKLLGIKQQQSEESRLAKSLGYQYGLDINVPAKAMLSLWQLKTAETSGASYIWYRDPDGTIKKRRRMQFYN